MDSLPVLTLHQSDIGRIDKTAGIHIHAEIREGNGFSILSLNETNISRIYKPSAVKIAEEHSHRNNEICSVHTVTRTRQVNAEQLRIVNIMQAHGDSSVAAGSGNDGRIHCGLIVRAGDAGARQ